MYNLNILSIAVFLFIVALSRKLWAKHSEHRSESLQHRHLPPGPPTKWLIGNLLDIPRESAWITFSRWKKEYGSLVHIHGLGNSILILNTQKAIADLLDKRGSNYSHRPIFTVAGELMGLDNSMPIMPYGNVWKNHRRLANTILNTEAVKKYHLVQEDLAALMCRAFLENPQDFMAHVRLTAGRIIMAVTYGLPIKTADDKYITHAEETMEIIGRATVPGTYFADLFPSLKHLPRWTPFITFHKDGWKGRNMIERLITKPFEHVQDEMKLGSAPKSFTRDLLEDPKISSEVERNEFENSVKWVSGAMYGAGGESTYATVITFILAMTNFPEVQRKAQKEIDDVVGMARLPVIEDRSSLHYVNALVKETMRWHPALPLGIARRTTKDDMYEGYFIPAGTTIISNVWALAEDNNIYPSTMFAPERFLEGENVVLDPHSYAFGFGRRICPGKQLGSNNIFILIASILASFNISPPVDSRGRQLPVEPRFTPSLVSHPEPFECRITPRSTTRASLVEDRAASANI